MKIDACTGSKLSSICGINILESFKLIHRSSSEKGHSKSATGIPSEAHSSTPFSLFETSANLPSMLFILAIV